MKRFKRKVVLWITIILIVLPCILLNVNIPNVSAGSVNLADPVFNFDKLLFVKHEFIRTTDHGSGGHMCDQYFGFNQVAGGGLYILNNCFSGSPTVTDVLANSYCTNGRYQGQKLQGGSFFSPDLSFDGTQIVFAYSDASKSYGRTWNQYTTWHLFKVNVDGTGLTQLTDGSYNDFQPCWLPSGKIAFISERRGGYGRCHGRTVPTYTLYTMNADGTDIRCISYHETNEWWPSVDNNGMIVWTRWDYVDRGDTQMHAPWIVGPDGMDARPIMQNYVNDHSVPKLLGCLRSIPESNKYVAVAAAHHQQTYGSIVMIDPDVEDDDSTATLTRITTDAGYPESTVDTQADLMYTTPWGLSENFFLVAHDPLSNTHGTNKNFGLYAIDSAGNKSLLYNDSGFSCMSPIPLRARTKPNDIPGSSSTPTPPDVAFGLVNVYDSLIPFPTGTVITQLRIIQVYPKTTPLADYAGEPRIAYVERKNTEGILGTVPVESDGSAYFYVKPGKCILFQALASDGTAVQTMRSDAFAIGGQTRVLCQGCHEPRHRSAANPDSVPLAFRRTPSTITPDPADTAGARPLCFPRLIQPILDSKCISCHNGSQVPDLRKGTLGTYGWSVSYNSLNGYVHKFPDVIWDYPRSKPGLIGARGSSLYTKLKTGHGSLTSEELRRFIIWMDANDSPYYGAYTDFTTQQNGGLVYPTLD